MAIDYNSWVGVKKGMMTVVEVIGRVGKEVVFKGLCDCGEYKTFAYGNFRRGHQLSCGCNRTPKVVGHDYHHPLYKVWISMRARCYNPTDQSYYNYGARGVRVCDEWNNNYQSYYDWCMANGWKPGLQVDKDAIPKKLGIPALLYSPEMCSILTRTENNQANSTTKLDMAKASEIRKSNLPLSKLATMYGVSKSTVAEVKQNKAWVE